MPFYVVSQSFDPKDKQLVDKMGKCKNPPISLPLVSLNPEIRFQIIVLIGIQHDLTGYKCKQNRQKKLTTHTSSK